MELIMLHQIRMCRELHVALIAIQRIHTAATTTTTDATTIVVVVVDGLFEERVDVGLFVVVHQLLSFTADTCVFIQSDCRTEAYAYRQILKNLEQS